MNNVKQIWQETAKQLEKVYVQREAENIACLLLEDVFGVGRTSVLSEDERLVDQEKLDELVGRLLHHEPIQYVTGIADFYGRKFHIQLGALIPRPETEELVDLIIRENQIEKPRILDVGVGSGCIAVTLALKTKGEVFGTDVSESALEIAKHNATSLGAKVSFIKNDILLEEFPDRELDILVSNPPYIPESEKDQISGNILRHEPALALFVPNDDPIIFHKRIADAGLKSLKRGGKLYFEIHENYGQDVKEFLIEIGYQSVLIHKDMQGKDRMVNAILI